MVNLAPTLINFDTVDSANGSLCVYESGKQVPFVVQRVFTISSKATQLRGDHAHRRCTQLLVCTSGRIRVSCDNGSTVNQYILDNMAVGVLIPPGLWAKQDYLEDDSVLMVLCDRGFEAEDYIRDYSDFKSFLALDNFS